MLRYSGSNRVRSHARFYSQLFVPRLDVFSISFLRHNEARGSLISSSLAIALFLYLRSNVTSGRRTASALSNHLHLLSDFRVLYRFPSMTGSHVRVSHLVFFSFHSATCSSNVLTPHPPRFALIIPRLPPPLLSLCSPCSISTWAPTILSLLPRSAFHPPGVHPSPTFFYLVFAKVAVPYLPG